ncbi:VPLPA-CTERM sorting domain-containing protein [Primorskyibacter sp. S187A]
MSHRRSEQRHLRQLYIRLRDSAVPLPAGGLLIPSGLAAQGLARRRKAA